MNLKKLDNRVKSMWLLIGGIFFLIWTILIVVTLLLNSDNTNKILLIILIPTTILVIFICFVYPILKYNCYSYGYDEKRIIIKHGVIFKHNIVIPVCQIQDLHSFQTPFMIMFKVMGFTISTAGSNFNIIGLSDIETNKMISELEENTIKRIGELADEAIY